MFWGSREHSVRTNQALLPLWLTVHICSKTTTKNPASALKKESLDLLYFAILFIIPLTVETSHGFNELAMFM